MALLPYAKRTVAERLGGRGGRGPRGGGPGRPRPDEERAPAEEAVAETESPDLEVAAEEGVEEMAEAAVEPEGAGIEE